MKYYDVDYEALFREGKSLKEGIFLDSRKFKGPILLDGVVYKPIISDNLEKIKIILKLDKLALERLLKIKGISKDQRWFLYDYESDTLLTKVFREKVFLEKRLRWINDVIITHEELKNNNLLYVDYHSGNFLAGKNITFLDVDSTEHLRGDTLLRVIEEYLLELVVSIFINYDLTLGDDNCTLYYLFSEFFDCFEIIRRDKLNLRRIFEVMCRKSEGEIEEFSEEIKRELKK